MAENLPAAHEEHVLEPSKAAVPASQLTQLVEPVSAMEREPDAQLKHSDDPEEAE